VENGALSLEDLDLIKDTAVERSKKLAGQKRREIDDLLNEVIYAQLKKLRAKMGFVRSFWDAYEIEGRELQLMQEQCLIERMAITQAKTGNQQTGGTMLQLQAVDFARPS